MEGNNSKSRHLVQNKLTRSLQLIRRLYHKTEAKHISQAYRKDKQLDQDEDKSLTYGEVEAASFMQILALTQSSMVPGKGRKFVDLGCGAGMPCICAAMSPYGFDTVLGIEIVDGLVDLAESLHMKLQDSFTAPQTSSAPVVSEKVKKNAAVEVDLLPVVAEMLQNTTETYPKAVDLLASEVCSKIGHKSYKLSIKKYKSFLKLLQTQPALCRVDADCKLVWSAAASATDNGSSGVVPETKESIDEECDGEKSTREESSGVELSLVVEAKDKELFLPLPPITYIKGSIFEHNWWDEMDVAYAASLLFTESMMTTLLSLVLQMKAGSWFITLKPLPLQEEHKDKVVLVNDSFFKMSWQMAKVYTYRVL